MADTAISKIDAAAEKAYAEAAAAKQAEKAETKAADDSAAAAVKKVAPKKAVLKKAPAKKAPAKKTAAKKAAVKKTAAKAATKPARKRAAKPAAKAQKPAAKPAVAKPLEPIVQLKEAVMAKAKTTDFTKTAKQLAEEARERAQNAFARTSELAGEVAEFNKANAEALLTSGKVLLDGARELTREQIEASKAALETVAEDARKLAEVRSPTDLFELQGEIARRNLDAFVTFGSKRAEKLLKIYGEAFAPIQNRISEAREKISKAA